MSKEKRAKWDNERYEKMIELYMSDVPLKGIADQLGTTVSNVMNHITILRRLGLNIPHRIKSSNSVDYNRIQQVIDKAKDK
jgi:biotin operon repressor